MNGKILFKIAVALLIASMFVAVEGLKGAEHPGRPGGGKAKPKGLTKDQLADAIEAHIKKVAAENNGYFPITDEKTGQKLNLELVKVHRKRVAKVGKDLYFSCVDFKTAEGKKKYDVDFFMKGAKKEDLTFSEFMIHKENGEERYEWYEEDGIWKKKPVEETEKPKEKPKKPPSEHPSEHPK
jgi:hypothetical protein